jgi:hypothetical protein
VLLLLHEEPRPLPNAERLRQKVEVLEVVAEVEAQGPVRQ